MLLDNPDVMYVYCKKQNGVKVISVITQVFLPSFFQRQVVVVHADGSKGGLLIGWKWSYKLLNSWATKHSCLALLQQESTGGVFLVTNVYGPSSDDQKQNFIQELKGLAPLVNHPWILGGDFNLVRWLIDRSGDRSSFELMAQFNDVILDLALIDIPLEKRRYTWTNKRPSPLSRLDRIFTTAEISLQFTSLSMRALEILVSDHAPLLLNCVSHPTTKKPFKLELFWLQNQEADRIIKEIWDLSNTEGEHAVERFQANCQLMHRRLRDWHCQNFSRIEEQLQFCKNTILFFDRIEEQRQLAQYELRFRIRVRERAYRMATIVESRWAHRARCKWLRMGDRNTRYFHAMASSRHRRNRISSITHEGRIISNESLISDTFKCHLESILGTDNRVTDFDPRRLYQENLHLSHLADPITTIEVEVAVKQMAKNQASGPDGLPNEFLQIHWNSVKEEVIGMVQNFYDHTLDLEPINRANIILIAKKENPLTVADYRPISVMNVIPKLISKILANRLRGVLSELISPCQTAFVKGRQITENFNATHEILQHLQQNGKPAMFVKIDLAKAFDSVN